MSDGRKSCLGFGFLIMALVLSGLSVFAGGISSFVSSMVGESVGISLKTGIYLAIGVFILLTLVALVFFISVRDWSWLPAIFGGVYAIMPDLVFGPEDDVLALVAGVAISGFLAYLKDQRAGKILDV